MPPSTSDGLVSLGSILQRPSRLRSVLLVPVTGLSTAADWALNFMVVMITLAAFNSIGVYTYVIFAAMNDLMFLVVYFLYLEMVNRSLEIDDTFADSNPWKPWDVAAITRRSPIRHLTLGEDISDSAEEVIGCQMPEKGRTIRHLE
jgi:Sugar (and other) transporter